MMEEIFNYNGQMLSETTTEQGGCYYFDISPERINRHFTLAPATKSPLTPENNGIWTPSLMENEMDMGSLLKVLRATSGMTLSELSQKTNLSISFLSRLENCKRLPSHRTLRRIADQLGGIDSYLRLLWAAE